jgi:hypothetical protein
VLKGFKGSSRETPGRLTVRRDHREGLWLSLLWLGRRRKLVLLLHTKPTFLRYRLTFLSL